MNKTKYDALMEKIGFKTLSQRSTIPSRGDIAALEEHLGYKLPSDYKEFLLKYGLTANDHGYWTIIAEDGSEYPLGVFYGVAPGSGYNLEHRRKSYEADILPSHFLPIANSSTGSILLSLAGDDCGSIYYWHNEDAIGGEPPAFLAKDFDSLIRQIVVKDS